MIVRRNFILALASIALTSVACLAPGPARAEDKPPPLAGEPAPDFKLADLAGEPVALSKLTPNGPVVLVVLRGFPGYQCPLCARQVQEFAAAHEKFRAAGAQVVFVYPGPAANLVDKAKEFVGERVLPAGMLMVVDPDYALTNAYRLRWDAPRETAYPSTFVIGSDGKVLWGKVSRTHGGRTTVAEVLAQLPAKP